MNSGIISTLIYAKTLHIILFIFFLKLLIMKIDALIFHNAKLV